MRGASFASSGDQLWLIILGYGVISGFGLGFAYIVPIAMLQKWFPDKTGLITGLAVGGFGCRFRLHTHGALIDEPGGTGGQDESSVRFAHPAIV